MNEHLELFKLLDEEFESRMGAMYTSAPCTIKLFDTAAKTVTVTLDHGGQEIADVNIAIIGTAQNHITTPTMKKGAKGLLLFSKYDLTEWVDTGEDENPIINFSINNAFFLSGVLIASDGMVYNNNATEILCEKLAIKNAQSDLIKELFGILTEIKADIELLSTAVVATSIGNQPLSCAAQLTASMTSLTVFLEKIGGFKDE